MPDLTIRLISCTMNPVDTAEYAASKCYDSKPSPDGKILRMCAKKGHTSVLEHMYFNFEISGVSRVLLAQLTRHRIASFSVRSQRYCNESAFDYVTPPDIQKNMEAVMLYLDIMTRIQATYDQLVELGINKEDARFILPGACETTLVMSINARSLMNLCHERLCTRAQWEIRRMTQLMRDEVLKDEKLAAVLKDFLVPKCERYPGFPFCPEGKGCCGRHPTLESVYQAPAKGGDQS